MVNFLYGSNTGEGYDEGQPPDALVNVTVAPMVMEVLQVLHLNQFVQFQLFILDAIAIPSFELVMS